MSWRDDLDKHAGAWGFYRLDENEVAEIEFDFSHAKIKPNANNWPELYCKVKVDGGDQQDARLEFWSLATVKAWSDKHDGDILTGLAIRSITKRDGKKINVVEIR